MAPVTRSHPIVVMPPSLESERELVPAVAERMSSSNGTAAHADEDQSDATQEFHVEQSEDWLDADEG